VATAYYARSAQIVSEAAAVLELTELAHDYGALANEICAAFRDEYVTPNARVASDSATAYAMALEFDLVDDAVDRARMAHELARICAQNAYTITTGFLGTPLVLPALSEAGRFRTAYRLLTQIESPSWLYPVTMGATTIWERWDSMLPDGRVNGSGMTSFNHYALGSVADWMHRVIGGLAPAAPGWRRVLVTPVPGPGVTSADASVVTPYGPTSCSWIVDGCTVRLQVEIPPNATATVVRPGLSEAPLEVGSGRHHWTYDVDDELATKWRGGDAESIRA
jgi:alpha-L-rhamnosidase